VDLGVEIVAVAAADNPARGDAVVVQVPGLGRSVDELRRQRDLAERRLAHPILTAQAQRQAPQQKRQRGQRQRRSRL